MGGTWVGAAWVGGTWMGSTWVGAAWVGGAWVGAAWVGAAWVGAAWMGSTWVGAAWVRAVARGAVTVVETGPVVVAFCCFGGLNFKGWVLFDRAGTGLLWVVLVVAGSADG
jgi:hypothetical protein